MTTPTRTLVTTAEAAAAVDRTPADIRHWHHKGYLTPLGTATSPRGRDTHLWDLTEVYTTADKHQKRSVMKSVSATPYGHTILHGLQGKPVYEGTTPPREVAKRRARNKTARTQRRVNRSRR